MSPGLVPPIWTPASSNSSRMIDSASAERLGSWIADEIADGMNFLNRAPGPLSCVSIAVESHVRNPDTRVISGGYEVRSPPPRHQCWWQSDDQNGCADRHVLCGRRDQRWHVHPERKRHVRARKQGA